MITAEPARQCRSCNAQLSRYNPDDTCTSCARPQPRTNHTAQEPLLYVAQPRPTPPDASNVGAIFRDYRALHHLTQGELAELLGVTQPYISQIERGLRHIRDIDELHRVAQSLRIDPDELGLLPQAIVERPLPATTAGTPAAPRETLSEHRRWRLIRQHLNANRQPLTDTAAGLYTGTPRVGRSKVITQTAWMAPEPVDLARIALEWAPTSPPIVGGGEPESEGVRPTHPGGGRYSRYSRVIRDLAPPTLFENRVSYRLLDLDWSDGQGRMRLGYTTYFDMVDVCEAAAHELAAAWEPHQPEPTWAQLPFRSLIKDPFDLARRPLLPSIDTLTIRKDGDNATFLLHKREAGKVAVAGGMYHIMPAGVFQPSSVAPWDQGNDFGLWQNMMREFSEEFLGNPEADGSGSEPIDYANTEPYRSLNAARDAGTLRAFCFGVGLDPLTLAGEILTAVVIDAEVYDTLFADLVPVNAEGSIVSGSPTSHTEGVAFTRENIDRLLTDEPLAPAAAACIDLAWQHRDVLLG